MERRTSMASLGIGDNTVTAPIEGAGFYANFREILKTDLPLFSAQEALEKVKRS